MRVPHLFPHLFPHLLHLPCALLQLMLLPCLALVAVAPAGAATPQDYLNPYASDVGRAIADDPAAHRPPLTPDGGESPACRALRIELERARNTPPAQRDIYTADRDRDGRPVPPRQGMARSQPGDNHVREVEERYRRQCPQ